jgi:hypothetical protein
MTMTPLDYGRSFILGKWPGNKVRLWIESRTRIIDDRSGTAEDYIQCASCKSEDTFAEKNLFYEDNYDFLPIFGPKYGVIFRRKVRMHPYYRTVKKSSQMWGGPIYHLVKSSSPEELVTPQAIIKATQNFHPIVSQTEIQNDKTGLRAIIEYPVKTLNTNRTKSAYQIDTGPVGFPDLARPYDKLVDRILLAFVAWNVPHFADFVIEVPTVVNSRAGKRGSKVMVHHYSRRVSLAARNRLFALM